MKRTRIFTYIVLFILVILNVISVKTYAADKYIARTYIDIPAEKMLVNHELKIEGWVMTTDEQAEIKVYIDGQEQQIQSIERKERPDVLKAITGYGTVSQNSEPGYIIKIDCSRILDGEHKLEVRINSRTGEQLTSASTNIDLRKFVAKTYIDMPNNANEYLIKDELEVEGWVMSDDENYQIKAYINGEEQEIQGLQKIERPDVLKAIIGYGTINQNPKPGYLLKIDTSKFISGSYNLEIRIVSSAGEILTKTNKKVIIQRYTSKSYIDSPEKNETVKPNFTISGWVMTDDENSEINVYIDGENQTIKQITRKERPDVIKAIQGYGGIEKNPNPGFELNLEPSDISNGEHILKIENVSREGKVISTSTTTINYENYKAKTYIDKITSNEKTINVEGWIMTDDDNSKINVYIDGTKQTIKNITRKDRTDVINAIKGYGGIEKNPKPGFNIEIDVSNFKDGNHILKLEIVSDLGQVIATNTSNVKVDKYNAFGYIDIPTSMSQSKNTLYVYGWSMSTDENAQIKMYINNQEQKMNDFERIEREDVLKVITGFGGASKNPKPGYQANLDVSKYEDGKYTLRVDVISREGEVMLSSSQTIVIYNKYDLGIDVSYHNGTINWAQVKQAGVDFAIIRAGFRGYGQSGTLNTDVKFVENMKGAIANDINIGVYFYSQAITVEEAIAEADYTIRLLRENGFENSLTFPIVIDTEKSTGRADNLTKEQRTTIVKAFCERIKQYGYAPMIYSNKWWLENSLDMNQLKDYEVWVAQYTGTDDPANNPSDYNGNYQIWQYTEEGKVDGISGNVDLSISYKKYL